MRSIITKRGYLLVAVILVLSQAGTADAKNTFGWRSIIYTTGNVCGGGNKELREVMKTGSELGYNEILWDNASILKLHAQPASCKDNLNGLLAYAQSLGMLITPASQGQTAPSQIDPNLGEAFPNIGTPFVVSGDKAVVAVDPALSITNPGFESGLSGWKIADPRFFSIDQTVKRSGNASLRCKDPIEGTYMRANQRSVTLRPHRTYELSVYVKSTSVQMISTMASGPTLSETGFAVMGGGIYLYNIREANGARPGMDWKRVTARFNSLTNSSALVSLQAFRSKINAFRGTVWFDDVEIREIGLDNVVRRPTLPVTVRNATGKILTEGGDYVIGDQELTIPAGSSAKEGDALTVDWFRPAIVSFNTPEVAYCGSQAWDIVRNQIKLEDEWFHNPPARNMKYGEWKAAGWDPACIQKYNIETTGAGSYIGSVARITEQLYREANCSRVVSSWNDMFDPYHNSKSAYHTTNGGTARSGFELTSTHIIRNWNNNKANALKSILYFAGLDTTKFLDPVTGQWRRKTTQQRQILLCGYFGGWNTILPALEKAENEHGLPNGAVIGVSYMSFKGPTTYGNMEVLKTACEAAGRWESGPVPAPAPTAGCPATELGIEQGSGKLKGLRVPRLAASSNGAIRFTLPKNAKVRLQVVDVRGRVVKTLVDRSAPAGRHQAMLEKKALSSGIYFVNLIVDQGLSVTTKKLAVF